MSAKYDAKKLAVGFVEATTEYNFTEVPEHIQQRLIVAAEHLATWIDTQGIYRIEPHTERPELT
jgi:hypothetical protein